MNKRYCENDEEVFEWEKGKRQRMEIEEKERVLKKIICSIKQQQLSNARCA